MFSRFLCSIGFHKWEDYTYSRIYFDGKKEYLVDTKLCEICGYIKEV
jgi:hypothetical protein